jgi:hypothetical protein
MLTWHADSPVVRRGIDTDGWPTWWHADGTLTKRTIIPVTRDGVTMDLEDVLTLERAPVRAVARPEAGRDGDRESPEPGPDSPAEEGGGE